MGEALFRASDILEMAVRIEQRGAAFYEACLDSGLDPAQREVFAFLADQEHRHQAVFSKMKSGVPEESVPESYRGELQSYVDSFVRDRVFDDPAAAKEKASALASSGEAVDWALDFERRSIEFYRGMEGVLRPSESETLAEIIEEEKDHIRRLEGLRRKMEEGDGEGSAQV